MNAGAELTVRGVRLRFSFGFFALWALLLVQSADSPYGSMTMAACLLHELGHIAAMRLMSIKIRSLYFYCGGIRLRTEKPLETNGFLRECIVLFSGPMVNILLCMIFMPVNRGFAMINLALALFNLLPVSTLDGGRLISAAAGRICPSRDIVTAQKICDLVFGAGAAVMFFASGSVSFTLPLTLGLIILEGMNDKYCG